MLMVVLVVLAFVSIPVWGEELSSVPRANIQGKKLLRWAAELTNKTLASEVPGRVKAWQEAGYDGLCFNISSHKTGSEPEALYKARMFFRWWSLTKRGREEFAPDIKALKSIKDWGCLTDNFLLTAVRPTYSKAERTAGKKRCPNWFRDDDLEIVFSNADLAASIAKQIGFKGIVLDVEMYGWAAKGAWREPWNYALYRSGWYKSCGHDKPLPFSEVAAKVRERGKQYAQALSDAFPGIVLLVAPGLYETGWESALTSGDLTKAKYGLFPAFVDGLLLGLDDKALLVSLYEGSYMMSQYRDLAAVRNIAKEQVLVISSVPELARQRISFAAGLWTDAAYGRTGGFSNTDAKANQRNPKRHEYATSNALAVSDHYAWHYGEASYFLQWGEGYPFQPDFDKKYVEPPPLIRQYWQATVKAHEPHDLNWAPEPILDTNDYSKFNADMAKRNRKFWQVKKKDGFKVVITFPEQWRFWIDREMLGRFSGSNMDSWRDASRCWISSKTCWQSQGFRENADAFYGVKFELPTDLNLDSQDIFLAIGSRGQGNVNFWFNGHWIGNNKHLIGVTKKLKPGQTNMLVLGFINKKGPGGLAGDVKLLSRRK